MGAKKQRGSRRGRVVGKAGAPAGFLPSAAVSNGVFDPEPPCASVNLHWQSGDGDNFIVGLHDGWHRWPKQSVVDLLRSIRPISIKSRDGEFVSEMSRVFIHTRLNRVIERQMPALAGYPSGVHVDRSGRKIVVRSSPTLVAPAAGEWPLIGKILERFDLAAEGRGIDQRPYFYSWLKVGRSSLRAGPGKFKKGHCMVLAGPAGCGKGFIQNYVITPMLGGRSANPGQFLVKDNDEFNGDLFEAEHLAAEELPMASQSTVNRVALAERMKQIVANEQQRLRMMRGDPLTVFPFWRLTQSINDDPDKMRSLPLITRDFVDKILLFLVLAHGMPMPTDTPEEEEAFRNAVAAEMPAFAKFIDEEWEIPQELLRYDDGRPATRFGFREYQHPSLVKGLFEDTPAGTLMMLVDAAEFQRVVERRGRDVTLGHERYKLWELPTEEDPRVNYAKSPGLWHGPGIMLMQLMTGESGAWACSVSREARDVFSNNMNAQGVGHLLARLEEDQRRDEWPRVSRADTKQFKGWAVQRPN